MGAPLPGGTRAAQQSNFRRVVDHRRIGLAVAGNKKSG
jgi:hypothetical protein